MSDVMYKNVKLGDLGYTYPGLSGKSKDDFGSGKPYIPYMNIFSNAKIKKSFLEYVDIKPGDRQNKVQKGDLFFTTSSETVEEVGMTSVLLDEIGEAYLNSFCFGFRLYNFDTLLPEFAAYLFRSEEVRKKISLFGQGSTRYNLPKTQLFDKLYLNIPDKERQIRIYNILTTCDTVIEQTQAAIEKYKAIKQGMLHDLFTRGLTANGQLRPTPQQATELYKQSELGLIPKEWEVKRLDYYFEFLKSGLSRLLSEQDLGIPVLISGNIQNDKIDFSSLKYWYINDPQGADCNQYILDVNDILMCFINSIDRIGKVAIFNGFKRPCIYTTNLFRIKANNNTIPKFLYYLLLSNNIQTEIKLISKPAVNQASFTTKDFCKLITVGIPLKEQVKIVNCIEAIDTKLQSEESLLSKYQSIKKGLMSDLLSGKRGV